MSQRIAIFDSGVGGLTIFKVVAAQLPFLPITYVCDNKNLPYGGKSEKEVITCVLTAVKALLKIRPIDLLVIACNTASTAALKAARAEFEIPIVGVVPAVKPAAALSKSKVIGLLATPGTIASSYTDDLIKEHAQGCEVIKVGSTKLVNLAEAKARGEKVDTTAVRGEIAAFFKADTDVVVLGCTHFPVLLEELKSTSPRPLTWLDSADAIAKRVATLVEKPAKSGAVTHEALFTDFSAQTKKLEPYLQSLGISMAAALALK